MIIITLRNFYLFYILRMLYIMRVVKDFEPDNNGKTATTERIYIL